MDAWFVRRGYYRDDIMAARADRPREAVSFALSSLQHLHLASFAGADDNRLWAELAKAYERADALPSSRS